jgi:mono/diheme cytochrome c family protein
MPIVIFFAALLGAGALIYSTETARFPGDPDNGQQIAQTWCARCHQVTADQVRPVVKGPQPPPFLIVAADTGKDDTYLRGFLHEQHLPMPTFRLTEQEKQDVLAYFHRLRR